MSQVAELYARWLADYYLLATILLALSLIGIALQKQPVRRLAVTKSTLVSLILLAVLCAIPGWSIVHLLTEEQPQPVAEFHDEVSAKPVVMAEPVRPMESDAPPIVHEDAAVPATPDAQPEPSFDFHLPWPALFAMTHLGGATCIVLWLVLGWIASARLRRTAQPAPTELVAVLNQVFGQTLASTQRPQLLTHERIDVAVALGALRPTILLPGRWIRDESPDHLRTVLAHESTHIVNHDLRWVALTRMLFIALWANPLFWITRRWLRRDQEALADAAAAELTSRQRYAEQLVAWARDAQSRPALHLSSAVGLWEGPSQLRQRIALLIDEHFVLRRDCPRGWRMASYVFCATAALALSLVTIAAVPVDATRPDLRQTTIFQHGIDRLGILPQEIFKDRPVVQWKVSPAKPESSPDIPSVGGLAVADGIVYGSDGYGRLFAMDSQSGQEVWACQTEGSDTQAPFIQDQTIYYACGKGVVALDRHAGTLLWEYEIPGGAAESSPIVIDNKLFITGYDGVMRAIDAKSGKQVWERELLSDAPEEARGEKGKEALVGDDSKARPRTPASDGRTIFQPIFDQMRLVAVDCATGEVRWSFKTDDWIYCNPVVHDGRVYIGSQDRHMYCLDAQTGKEIWRFKTISRIEAGGALCDGRLYFGCCAGVVYCVDAKSGKELWRFSLDQQDGNSPIYCAPLVTRDGALYIAGMEGQVYCLDAAHGQLRWKVRPSDKSQIDSNLATDGERLFIATRPNFKNAGESAIFALGVAAAPGDANKTEAASEGKADSKKIQSAVAANETENKPTDSTAATKTGTLTMRFEYDGVPPERKELKEFVVRAKLDNRELGRIDVEKEIGAKVFDESLIVGKDGGIADVFVWVRSEHFPMAEFGGKSPPRQWDNKQKAYVPVEYKGPPLTITYQKGKFEPRITAFEWPRQVVIRNDDPKSTNFYYFGQQRGQQSLFLKPGEEQKVDIGPHRFPLPLSVMSRVKEFKAWIFTCDNPFFAVSNVHGRIQINGLPPGKLEFQAWHERSGYLKTAKWPMGRFRLAIKPGDNDLGTVKLPPAVFNESEVNSSEPEHTTPTTATKTEEEKPVAKSTPEPNPQKALFDLYRKHFKLGEPNVVGGFVVDEKLQPIANAKVSLYRTNWRDITRELIAEKSTDADGKVRFDQVFDLAKEFPGGKIPPDNSPGELLLQVVVRAPGRVSDWRFQPRQLVAKRGEPLMIIMPPATTLRGRVTGPDGKPVAGALVAVGNGPPAAWAVLKTVRSDADGNYVTDDVPHFDLKAHAEQEAAMRSRKDAAMNAFRASPQVLILTVEHPNFAAGKAQIEKTPGTTDIQLQPAAILAGRIVFGDSGKPAAGARVWVAGHHQKLSETKRDDAGNNDEQRRYAMPFYATSTRADSDGKYRFATLPPGYYHLLAEMPGWVHVGLRDVLAEAGKTNEAPDLTLTKGGTVSIRLIDAKTREPIQVPPEALAIIGSSERPIYDRPPIEQRLSANKNGLFELSLPAGKHEIYIGAVYVGEEWKWMGGAATADGNSNAIVTVTESKTVQADLPVTDSKAAKATATYVPGPLPKAELKARPSTQNKQNESSNDKSKPMSTLRLQPNVVIVRVLDEKDKPIAGAEAFLFRVNQFDGSRKLSAKTSTDAAGQFRFDNVIDIDHEFPDRKFPSSNEPGDEMLQGVVRAPGRISQFWWMLKQSVAQQGDYQQVQMFPSASLRGTVTDADGKPVAGALVSIGDGGIERWEGAMASRTDAAGNYKIDDAGPYNAAELDKQIAEQKRQLQEQEAKGSRLWTSFIRHPVLTVEHRDYATKHTNFEKSPGTKDIQLDPAASLEGRVVFADSGKPAAGVLVGAGTSVADRGPPTPELLREIVKVAVRTDTEGKYRVTGLPAGKFDLWAETPGWVNVGLNDVVATPRKTASVPDLTFTKGGVVSARLVDAKTREPIAVQSDARAYFLIEPVSQRLSVRPQSAPFITANSKGRFELNLTPGKKKMGAGGVEVGGKFEFTGGPTTELTVVQGETVDVDLPVSELKKEKVTGHAQAVPRAPSVLGQAAELRANGKPLEAIKLLKTVLDKDPNNIDALMVRADAWNTLGDDRKAIAEYEQILKLKPSGVRKMIVWNNLAFTLAASPDDSVRDGKRAVDMAETAQLLQEKPTLDVLDTLAAACAEVGQFDRAIKAEQEAIKLAPETQREELRKYLKLYEAHKPRRETRATNDQPADKKEKNGGANTSTPKAAEKSAQGKPPVKQPSDANSKKYDVPITVTGIALDDAGQPITGAQIYLASPRTNGKPLATTNSDNDGKYRFENVRLPIEPEAGKADVGSFEVFAQAKGFGLAWRPHKWFYPKTAHAHRSPIFEPGWDSPENYGMEDAIELDLHFGLATTLRGRIVNDAGEPIANAPLAIRRAELIGDLTNNHQLESLNWPSLVPESIKVRRSDNDGRFEFTALPANYRFWIDVRPPGYTEHGIYAATQRGPQENVDGIQVFGDDFEVVFARPRTVKLRVVYSDTQKPAPKVGVGGNVSVAGFWETTDGNGLVNVPLPDGTYKLGISPRHGTPYMKSEAEVVVSENSAKDVTTLTLQRAAEVDIEVVDAESNKPLSGVDVWIDEQPPESPRPFRQVHGYRSWEVETRISHYDSPTSDANGKMHVLFEPGQRRIGVGLKKFPKDYEQVEPNGKLVDLEAGKPQSIQFQMRKREQPAASAESTKDASIESSPAERVAENVNAKPAAATVTQLDPTELTGRVDGPDGKPMAGVIVDAYTWYPGNETKTDDNGRFLLKNLDPREPVEIEFRKTGFGPRHFNTQHTGTKGWVVQMDNSTYMQGQVVDPQGEPVPTALIRAERKALNENGNEIGEVFTDVKTDKNGNFRLYLEPDKYGIKVRVPGRGVARFEQQTIAKGEKKLFNINLERGQTFRAAVIDAISRKPVEGIILFNWQHKGIEGKSNAAGLLEVPDMFPGKFGFQITAAGEDRMRSSVAGNYARWWSEQATEERERRLTIIRYGLNGNWDDLSFDIGTDSQPATIYLEPCATVTGRVIDPDGKPVAGATVAPAATGSGNSLTGDARYSYETKSDGTFEMKLPASGTGKYNLIAHDGKYEKWRKWANVTGQPFQTQPGDHIDKVELRLTRPATIRGRAMSDSSNPVANHAIRAADVEGHDNRYYVPTTKTDAKGDFELKFVGPGKHYVQFADTLDPKDADSGTSTVVDVKEGESIDNILIAPPDRRSEIKAKAALDADGHEHIEYANRVDPLDPNKKENPSADPAPTNPN